MNLGLSYQATRCGYSTFSVIKDYIILTHAFRKQTDSVPQGEIKKAQTYRADFLSRFSEKKIKEAKK